MLTCELILPASTSSTSNHKQRVSGDVVDVGSTAATATTIVSSYVSPYMTNHHTDGVTFSEVEVTFHDGTIATGVDGRAA